MSEGISTEQNIHMLSRDRSRRAVLLQEAGLLRDALKDSLEGSAAHAQAHRAGISRRLRQVEREIEEHGLERGDRRAA